MWNIHLAAPLKGVAARTAAVVLVHGIWMTGTIDMAYLRRRMQACGFRVYIFHYGSVRSGLRDNAARLDAYLKRIPETTIHLVGHSLGGRVIRRLLLDAPAQRPGRIVTLGTPHSASRVAQRIGACLPGRWILGRGRQALTEELPPWQGEHELGLVLGNRPYGIGRLVGCLPFPNDGTVAVAEAMLAGATDTIVLPVTHTSMLLSRKVADQICRFLHCGRFER